MSKNSKYKGGQNKPLITRFGNSKAIFDNANEEDSIHPQIIKMARKSGNLNLANKGLTKVPQKVFSIHELDDEEANKITVNMSQMESEDKWWERNDLTRLYLNSNMLLSLDPLINKLASLQILDVSDNQLKSVPSEVGDLKGLTYLNLSRNNIETLPEAIGQLDELKSLIISHNNLTCLPENIATLYLLEVMDLSYNAMTSLPRGFGYLQRLSKLNISNNNLEELPLEIGDMFALSHMDATCNQLKCLPKSMSLLQKIEEIILRQNKLTDIPDIHCLSLRELHLGVNNIKVINGEKLEGLSGLRILDISQNGIESLPDEITLLQSLERLDLTNNYLSSLPYHIGFLPHLRSLSLDGNPLRLLRRDIVQRGTAQLMKYLASKVNGDINALPGFGNYVAEKNDVEEKPVPDQYEMRNTKVLIYNEKAEYIPDKLFENGHLALVRTADLSQNLLKSIPQGVQQMSGHLKELILRQNKLTIIDSFIGNLQHLQYIDLQNNLLMDLPSELSSLNFLREVNISYNRFTSLPSCIFNLTNLEILFAGDNKIESIPIAELMGLTMLATLDLHNNDIDFVPPQLGKMTQINTLLLGGNAFRVPRSSVLAKGTRALMDYLRSRIVDESF